MANRYRFKNGTGEIGIISSVSKPFCHSCTRSRITMDGKFVTCLFANEGLDLRKPIRDDLTDTEILKILSDCCIFFERVVFPAPEGEDKTIIRGLLKLFINEFFYYLTWLCFQ